ncbi:MBL fold metallo-hydrolase [Nocardia aurantia]|uniref:Metallo-beta-lactamase domain-containing protein n=1 Tax=Nocardia aurantia TaxID=2585199 RepID=A0A7K0E1T5_9NOCA|nr:MBL fold metallo-hydrolase [Nocardia aurantia]MQY31841.1 hypothetical protein [Nocardia aurantia]
MSVTRIDPVIDAEARVEPGALFAPPASAAEDWQTSAFEGGWVMPMGGFLLRSSDRTILVDAGLGPEAPAGIESSGKLLDTLAGLGFSPDDITDVVLTHLHIDHVGWVARRGEPVFSHARHHFHRADWDWVRTDAPTGGGAAGVSEVISTVSDTAVLADGERTEIADSVVLRRMAGHTPGNCVVDVETSHGSVILLGDTAHHPLLLIESGWTSQLDEDRVEAARARHQLAEELERSGALAFGAHFPDNRAGRIVRDGDGLLRWRPVSTR